MDDAETITALRAELTALSAENDALALRLDSTLRQIEARSSLEGATAGLVDTDEEQAQIRRVNAIIASVPGAIWEARGNAAGTGNVLGFISDYITPMLGYRPDECVGNPGFWRGVVHPEDGPRIGPAIGEIYAKGGGIVQYRWLRKDGRPIWIESRMHILRGEHGEHQGARAITMDISARKDAELARQRLQAEVLQAQSEALAERAVPLLPISNEILVVPLIGSLDRGRIELLNKALLHGLGRARFVILDLTGVHRVDAETAEALLAVTKALRLLGATVVLTGISPEMAQPLVNLVTEGEGVVLRSTVESGIAHANRARL